MAVLRGHFFYHPTVVAFWYARNKILIIGHVHMTNMADIHHFCIIYWLYTSFLKSVLGILLYICPLKSSIFPTITKTCNCPCNIQRIVSAVKIENFSRKCYDIFLIFAQNIDCGYTLEPPRRGGSNEYSQTMSWSKNKTY